MSIENHHLVRLAALLILLALVACSSPPPKFITATHHPLIERDGSLYIVADSCVKFDTLSDADDHFVSADSRAIAAEVLKSTTNYMLENGIQIVGSDTPFVCGAIHNAGNQPQPFGIQDTDKPVPSVQPFDVSNQFKDDEQYVSALANISTYIFMVALKSNGQSETTNIFSTHEPYIVNANDFRSAVAYVNTKTGRSNLLYIGITAIRESPGKSTLKAVTKTVASAALAGVIGGVTQMSSSTMINSQGQLFKPGVTVFYPIFQAVQGVQGKQVVAGLVDLQSGELVWTNAIEGAVASMNALLHDVVHMPAPHWIPPGKPPVAPASDRR